MRANTTKNRWRMKEWYRTQTSVTEHQESSAQVVDAPASLQEKTRKLFGVRSEPPGKQIMRSCSLGSPGDAKFRQDGGNLEGAMQIRADHPPGPHSISRSIVKYGERRHAGPRRLGLAHMNLVGSEATVRFGSRTHHARDLAGTKFGGDGEQPETGNLVTRRFDVLRIGDALAQHLVSAADSDHRRAPAMLLNNPRFEIPRSQPLQIRGSALGAREEDEIEMFLRWRSDPAGIGKEAEISGVGDSWKPHDRAPLSRGRWQRTACARHTETVLVVQVNIARERKDAQTWTSGSILQHAPAVVEQKPVAAKLVHRECAQQRALLWRQEADGSNHRCEHAAALDIGHQQPRRLHARRKPEVHQIELPQVELGHAARALHHDHVEARRQTLVRVQNLTQ